MGIGQGRYQDVLDLLADAGFGATFTQTGGMNAALEVLLDSGHILLITDAEDSLSWDRDEHRGWGVGLYPPDQANTDGERLAFESTEQSEAEALLPLVHEVLSMFAAQQRRRPAPSGGGTT
ncbi:MAG: hypothetical protein M3P91_02290 [Actinomycetota bacterium]|nr:hypothetical protein [Actinomycetota bacterium]